MDSTGIHLINLSNYVKPEIKEYIGRKWVLNGDKNEFFKYIIERKNGSPTNGSIINTYNHLLYGKGISQKGQDEVYEDLVELFSKKDQRDVLGDFKTFGMFAAKLVRAKGGGVGKIKHFPMDKLGMGKAVDGEINEVYYCWDWTNPHKYKPVPMPIFKDTMTDKEMILLYKPYQSGNFYYAQPDYVAGLQYAEIEEEVSNFSINHIKNGLSFGYVINMNNGAAASDEQRDEIERRIKRQLTGSSNAGKFVLSFNEGKEAEVTVVPLDVNDAHNQWESLREDAKYQILTAHGVTSPLLFSIQSSTGFSSNADELNTASKILQDFQISPRQEAFLDAFKPVFELAGLETDLEFIELRDSYKDEAQPEPTVTDEAVDDLEEENEEAVELNTTYNDYPEAARNNAKRALKWAKENGWGSCGTSVGKRRASQIANGENLSRDTIARMASFKRHEQHKDVPYSEGCGGLMYDAWGGSAGVNWAISKLKKIDAKLSEMIEECPEADELINLGDNNLEGWECIDERDVDYDLEEELDDEIDKLNNPKKNYIKKLVQFLSTGTARPNAKSEQDKEIDGVKYKVRYEYYPKSFSVNSRPFCKRMVLADKLYRKEDIIAMDNKVVNPGWGPNGADKYSIWLYKGGGGCHHKWRRKTFRFTGKGKGDTKSPLAPTVSTNKAEKEGYRVRNPKEVAMKPKDMKNEGFLKPRR